MSFKKFIKNNIILLVFIILTTIVIITQFILIFSNSEEIKNINKNIEKLETKINTPVESQAVYDKNDSKNIDLVADENHSKNKIQNTPINNNFEERLSIIENNINESQINNSPSLNKQQIIDIIKEQNNTQKLSNNNESVEINKNIEERMNILEKLYGPKKKTRGNIEEGITSKIQKLENRIDSNNKEFEPYKSKIDTIDDTIETKIDNYLKDEDKTGTLTIKFKSVNSVYLNTTGRFTAPYLTIDQNKTNITRTLDITGDINVYNGINKNIQIKNNSTIIANNFNGTCQKATNADKLLDNGIYKSNTELKVKFAEEPVDDNSLSWSQKITNYLNNNKLANYNQTDTISKGISTLVNGNDLQLRKLKLEEIKNVDGMQEVTLIGGLSRFKFGNDGIKYSNNDGQNWVNKKLPIYRGIQTNNITSTQNEIVVDKLIRGKVSVANNLNNFIGIISYFTTTTAPNGWLICDGSEYNSTNDLYKKLFDVIGFTFGQNGNKFKVPDLRGLFIRSLDNGKGVDSDPNRTLGNIQDDTFKSHKHEITDPKHKHGTYAGDGGGNRDQSTAQDAGINKQGGFPTAKSATGITINHEGDEETRPKNMALLACIKYK